MTKEEVKQSNINQVTDEQLFEMYKNHPDEGTRMTAFLEMARRVGMERMYLAKACTCIRRNIHAMKMSIVATFQTCRLSGQQRV